jgi:hypothetical protein
VLRTWDVDGYRNASIVWAKDSEPDSRTPQASAGRSEEAAEGQDDRGTMSPQLLEASILATELQSVITTWLDVVERRGYEQVPGEIVEGLADFGPSRAARDYDQARAGPVVEHSSWSDYERLGLWAAAVINPLPPLGVAPEIRVLALEMTDSRARLALVLQAAERSLAMISRSSRRLSPDMLRILVFVAIAGGLMISHTSILDHLGWRAWDAYGGHATQPSIREPSTPLARDSDRLKKLLSLLTFGMV